ncbi:MAG: glycosyltransferase [Polyangia bacterium]
MTERIPAIAHFVWFGSSFPWLYGLALRAAVERGGFERAVLHHQDSLEGEPGWEQARADDRIEPRRLDPERALLGSGPRGEELVVLYRRLEQPAARSNMVRAAILAAEGGVYMDTDVVCVRSFGPLLDAGVFCGEERIALPAEVRRSRSPAVWAGAAARLAVRDLLRRAPAGWRAFGRLEGLYPAAVNNAVLGARPGHPLVAELLERMVEMPPRRQTVRFALGTGLLQDLVRERGAEEDLRVHRPDLFYPLPPEISEHWFRIGGRPRLEEALTPRTVAVHWYASVRTRQLLPRIDERYVRRHSDRQLLAALLEPLTRG